MQALPENDVSPFMSYGSAIRDSHQIWEAGKNVTATKFGKYKSFVDRPTCPGFLIFGEAEKVSANLFWLRFSMHSMLYRVRRANKRQPAGAGVARIDLECARFVAALAVSPVCRG